MLYRGGPLQVDPTRLSAAVCLKTRKLLPRETHRVKKDEEMKEERDENDKLHSLVITRLTSSYVLVLMRVVMMFLLLTAALLFSTSHMHLG